MALLTTLTMIKKLRLSTPPPPQSPHDDDTFYWIDRFGPDSFEIFREDLGPDDETEEE
eukprot:SAG22_NODE_6122_length_895_cov_4.087940_3_plen_57_part_01